MVDQDPFELGGVEGLPGQSEFVPAGEGSLFEIGKVIVVEFLIGPHGGQEEMVFTQGMILGEFDQTGEEGMDPAGCFGQQFEQPVGIDSEQVEGQFAEKIRLQQSGDRSQVGSGILTAQPGGRTLQSSGQCPEAFRSGKLLSFFDLVEEGDRKAGQASQVRVGKLFGLSQLADFQTEKEALARFLHLAKIQCGQPFRGLFSAGRDCGR